MKKGIMKFVVAIAFFALPSICPAQGFLGTLLQGVAQGLQQVNQQMQQQRQQQMQQQQIQQQQQYRQQQQNNGNNVQGGFKTNSGRLIDQTYMIDVVGVPSTPIPSTSNSSSSTSSTRLCSACAGKGNCNVCRNHAGWAGVNPSAGKCRSCNGTAVCYICHGAGRVSN